MENKIFRDKYKMYNFDYHKKKRERKHSSRLILRKSMRLSIQYKAKVLLCIKIRDDYILYSSDDNPIRFIYSCLNSRRKVEYNNSHYQKILTEDLKYIKKHYKNKKTKEFNVNELDDDFENVQDVSNEEIFYSNSNSEFEDESTNVRKQNRNLVNKKFINKGGSVKEFDNFKQNLPNLEHAILNDFNRQSHNEINSRKMMKSKLNKKNNNVMESLIDQETENSNMKFNYKNDTQNYFNSHNVEDFISSDSSTDKTDLQPVIEKTSKNKMKGKGLKLREKKLIVREDNKTDKIIDKNDYIYSLGSREKLAEKYNKNIRPIYNDLDKTHFFNNIPNQYQNSPKHLSNKRERTDSKTLPLYNSQLNLKDNKNSTTVPNFLFMNMNMNNMNLNGISIDDSIEQNSEIYNIEQNPYTNNNIKEINNGRYEQQLINPTIFGYPMQNLRTPVGSISSENPWVNNSAFHFLQTNNHANNMNKKD